MCPAGQFQRHENSDACACTQCPRGRSAQFAGSVGHCEACTKGRYQDSAMNNVACKFCAAGKFSLDTAVTTDACILCQFGKFGSMGASKCGQCPTVLASCPGGKFRDTKRISCECTDCAAGQFSSSATATSCVKCAACHYARRGQTACSQCVKGKAAEAEGKSLCDSCKPGTYSSQVGQLLCDECPSGQYQNLREQTSCTDCPCGKYMSAKGSRFCISCDESTLVPSCDGCTKSSLVQPTLSLDTVYVVPSLLESRADAVSAVDNLQNQLATCTATFNATNEFVAQQGGSAPCSTSSHAASCAGFVPLDIDGNKHIDSADSVQLFIAMAMRDFGAKTLLQEFQAKHTDGAVQTPSAILTKVEEAFNSA